MKEQETYQPLDPPASHLDENDLGVCAEYLCNLRPDLPDDLRKHLEECPQCRAEAMAITDLITPLPSTLPTSLVTHHSSLVTRHSSRLVRLIASLAAVFLLAWFIQLLRDRKPDTDTAGLMVSADSVSAADSLSANATYAQAFLPDAELERLIPAVYRTAHNPRPHGPDNGTEFRLGERFMLSWAPQKGRTYSLAIFDNHGSLIVQSDTLEGNKYFRFIDLAPGLYYWKFMDEEELWKVGKFVVK